MRPEALEIPLKRKKPTMWFVNSMSDLFHESVTFDQLCEIFDVMGSTPHHIYQILTKRPDRMAEVVPLIYRELAAREGLGLPDDFAPPSHIWLGVTVENQRAADERIPLLLQTPAAVRFLSCEPLLEDISFFIPGEVCNVCGGKGTHCDPCSWTGFDVEPINMLDEIDWVIAGGESGPNARPCDIEWIRSIVRQCADADVPCFVKQLGSTPLVKRTIFRTTGKGHDMAEWPEDLRVRQMPVVA
jgi:protein gp37